MAFNPAKRQWLKETAGKTDAELDAWEASLKQAEVSLTNAGIARKDDETASAEGATGTPPASTDPLLTVIAQMKEMGESVGDVLTVVQANKSELDAKLDKVVGAVMTLAQQVKKSQDEIVAGAYTPPAARGTTGYVASEQAPGTVAVQEAKAAPEKDWFAAIVLNDFAVAGAEAVSTPGQATLDNAGLGVQINNPPVAAGAAAGGS